MEHTPGKSSDTTKKWLIGCGIGCGAVALILILLGVGGFFFVRNIVQEFEESEELLSSLTEKYGRIREYCPDPDGIIRGERLEVFLSARQACDPARLELEKALSTLSEGFEKGENEAKARKGFFRMLGVGFGLIPQIADYFKARNQALVDAGMGVGEYYYIYVVAYYSWLGKDPEDGPPFSMTNEEDFKDWDWDEEDLKEVRRDDVLRKLNRMMLPVLRNQYAKLSEGELIESQEDWQEILAAEVAAMEADRFRLLWQDGLPDVIKASLLPFRERLEASYSPMVNTLEIALEQR